MSVLGQGKHGGSAANDDGRSIVARLTGMSDATKRVAKDAGYVSKKLLKSTGKAAWLAGTTFLILVVPLIIEMDREQQFNELELQHQSLLGSRAAPLPPSPK
ncbi:hypothetical protein ES288_A10G127400v1 [Gossypium darwinii]|uniref:Uncharacterized protein n=1 Tax=Gossypium darwinii TaxID=34276 RepID=A0A5D2EYM9_GOSDA|nr:hypothetical protein ES288_A10G127400v1 [Gossypium darwinii]